MKTQNKKQIYLILLIIFLIIIAVFIGYNILLSSHWSMKDIKDDSIVYLNQPINTIQDALAVADKRAKEWRKNTELQYISIFFDDSRIFNMDGIIEFWYIIQNNDIIGFRYVIFCIDIDLQKKAITGFETFPDGKAFPLPEEEKIHPQNWTLTIPEAFQIAEKEIGENFYVNYKNPMIIIRPHDDIWNFEVCERDEEQKINYRFNITIDATGKKR